MMRRCFTRFSAAAVSGSASTSEEASHKLKTLHKLLTGEVHFKNGVPLKYCNVVHNFGEQWQAEIEAYANKLPTDQKTVLQRQISRVLLTRYTTRELALYGGDGPENLDKNAQTANVEQGRLFLEKFGEDKFKTHVQQEAKNANWSEAQVNAFINSVKRGQ